MAEYTDIIQIGARNAQNFQLLIAAAKTGKPVLLKRGLSMKIEEWLLAGEYVLANENPNLMFCERGIRTFETYTRNTLDLSTIPIIKRESHAPIVIDPSQGAGRADLVATLCKGAVAMGASSRALGNRAKTNPNFFLSLAATANGKFLPQTGAALIKDAAGNIIGSAGASGGTGDEDEACCVAGIEAAGLVADASE